MGESTKFRLGHGFNSKLLKYRRVASYVAVFLPIGFSPNSPRSCHVDHGPGVSYGSHLLHGVTLLIWRFPKIRIPMDTPLKSSIFFSDFHGFPIVNHPFFFGHPIRNTHMIATKSHSSMDWFKGKFTGKTHIYWENLWFPVKVFP